MAKLAQLFTGKSPEQMIKAAYQYVSGVESLSGSLGSGAGVGMNMATGMNAGAAVAAVLGVIAAATGNRDIGMAAQAAGLAVSAVTTGVAVGAAAGSTAAASAAASIGMSAGAIGAGAAMAPVAAAIIAFSIANMISPGSAPELSDIWTGGKMDPYLTFNKELAQNQSRQADAFTALSSGLNYAQSKEEVGQLVNSYKNYVSTITGIQLEDRSGTGDPYRLSAIPGQGDRTHGFETTPIDWAGRETFLQNKVNFLADALPGERITAAYGQPGGSFEGDAGMRLWTQHLDREQNAPFYSRGAEATSMQVGEGETTTPQIDPGHYGILQTPDDLRYGQEGYKYTGSGQGGVDFPEPGKYIGEQSAQSQQFAQQMAGGGMGMEVPEASSAGKIAPPANLLTGASGTPKPEVDNQREMVAGSRGAPAAQPGAPGAQQPAPGGFGGPVQGGFSVGQDNAFGMDDLQKKGKMGGTI